MPAPPKRTAAPPPRPAVLPPARNAVGVLTVTEAAQRLGLSKSKVEALAEAGKLTKVPMYYGKWYTILSADVERMKKAPGGSRWRHC